jgi:hypothetical protein
LSLGLDLFKIASGTSCSPHLGVDHQFVAFGAVAAFYRLSERMFCVEFAESFDVIGVFTHKNLRQSGANNMVANKQPLVNILRRKRLKITSFYCR